MAPTSGINQIVVQGCRLLRDRGVDVPGNEYCTVEQAYPFYKIDRMV